MQVADCKFFLDALLYRSQIYSVYVMYIDVLHVVGISNTLWVWTYYMYDGCHNGASNKDY